MASQAGVSGDLHGRTARGNDAGFDITLGQEARAFPEVAAACITPVGLRHLSPLSGGILEPVENEFAPQSKWRVGGDGFYGVPLDSVYSPFCNRDRSLRQRLYSLAPAPTATQARSALETESILKPRAAAAIPPSSLWAAPRLRTRSTRRCKTSDRTAASWTSRASSRHRRR